MRAFTAALLCALMTRPARAEPVAAELAALTDARHRCEADLERLERHAREDARVRIEQADCLVRLGRLETAGDALAPLFGEGGGGPALTPHDLGEGLALLAVVLARTGRIEQAEAVRQRIPTEDSARAHRVEAVLLVASGRSDAAWPLVDAALARWPRDPHAIRGAAEVASLDPDGVTPSAKAAIRRPAEFVRQHNLAVAALGAGAGERCLRHVEAGLAVASETEQSRLLVVGYACAVSAGRPDVANRMMLARRSVAALPPRSVARHAELLIESGRAQQAVRMLGFVRTDDVAVQTDVGSLRIRANVALGDLDAALGVATGGPSHPVTRANLARALVDADRPADARSLLLRTCAELDGRAAANCAELLGWLER